MDSNTSIELSNPVVRLRSAVAPFAAGTMMVLFGFLLIYFDRPGAILAPYLSGRTFDVNLPAIFGFIITFVGIWFMMKTFRQGDLVVEQTVPSSDLDVAVGQLAKNYDILRAQTTQGFLVAMILMVLGVLVIFAGAAGELFGFANTRSNLTTIAGIVVDVVSGIGLYLFKSTFNRLNSISDLLLDTWRVLAAFKKADDLPEDKRSEVQAMLIERLITPSSPSPALQPKSAKVSKGHDNQPW